MSDLINRQDAIDAINEEIKALNSAKPTDAYLEFGALMFCKNFIKQLPSAQKKGEWIPVTERLPIKTGKYLVTVKNGNVYAGTYDAYEDRFQCAAIAWQELPEPYTED